MVLTVGNDELPVVLVDGRMLVPDGVADERFVKPLDAGLDTVEDFDTPVESALEVPVPNALDDLTGPVPVGTFLDLDELLEGTFGVVVGTAVVLEVLAGLLA